MKLGDGFGLSFPRVFTSFQFFLGSFYKSNSSLMSIGWPLTCLFKVCSTDAWGTSQHLSLEEEPAELVAFLRRHRK